MQYFFNIIWDMNPYSGTGISMRTNKKQYFKACFSVHTRKWRVSTFYITSPQKKLIEVDLCWCD